MKLWITQTGRALNIFPKTINIIYGSNNSGKTSFLESLREGFSGKEKENFLVDMQAVEKNQFDIFFYDAKEDINEHFKISSKSILSNIILDKVLNDNENIENLVDEIKIKAAFLLKNLEGEETHGITLNINETKIREYIADIFEFKHDAGKKVLSSGLSKKILYSYALKLPKKAKTSIYLIDNFDNDFDLETTLEFIKFIIERYPDCYFFFTTSKPQTFKYLYEHEAVNSLYMKNSHLYGFENVRNTINQFLVEYYKTQDKSLDHDYLIQENEIDKLLKTLFLHNLEKIGLLITNNNYIVTNEKENFKVQLNYSSDFERFFLLNFITFNQ